MGLSKNINKGNWNLFSCVHKGGFKRSSLNVYSDLKFIFCSNRRHLKMMLSLPNTKKSNLHFCVMNVQFLNYHVLCQICDGHLSFCLFIPSSLIIWCVSPIFFWEPTYAGLGPCHSGRADPHSQFQRWACEPLTNESSTLATRTVPEMTTWQAASWSELNY